jgi:hypothetical protein
MISSLKRAKLFLVIAVITLASVVITPSAYAATTALDTGTSSFDNFNLTSGQYFAFALDADSAFTVESTGFIINTGKTSADLTGSTVTFYSGHPSSPTNSSNLLGTLTFSSLVSEASKLRVTYTGSVSIPAAGRYWWKIGNLASGKDIWIRMGAYTGHTGTWTAWNGTANWDLNGSISNSVGEYPKVLITGTPGGSGGGGSSDSSAQAEADRQEANRKRQAAIATAREKINSDLIAKNTITPNDLVAAELPLKSVDSLKAAFEEFVSIKNTLTKPLSTEAIEELKFNKYMKYAMIERITGINSGIVYGRDLVKFGLIDQSVPMKQLLTYRLLKMPQADRDSIEEINKYFTESSKFFTERKTRIAALFKTK